VPSLTPVQIFCIYVVLQRLCALWNSMDLELGHCMILLTWQPSCPRAARHALELQKFRVSRFKPVLDVTGTSHRCRNLLSKRFMWADARSKIIIFCPGNIGAARFKQGGDLRTLRSFCSACLAVPLALEETRSKLRSYLPFCTSIKARPNPNSFLPSSILRPRYFEFESRHQQKPLLTLPPKPCLH
jgi:hypothetical protein